MTCRAVVSWKELLLAQLMVQLNGSKETRPISDPQGVVSIDGILFEFRSF